MSAVPRPSVSSMLNVDQVAELERELKHREQIINALTRELTRAISATRVQSALVVDGKFTVVMSNGVVQERAVVDAPRGSYGYVERWIERECVPHTPAAIARAALQERAHEHAGMAVVAG